MPGAGALRGTGDERVQREKRRGEGAEPDAGAGGIVVSVSLSVFLADFLGVAKELTGIIGVTEFKLGVRRQPVYAVGATRSDSLP